MKLWHVNVEQTRSCDILVSAPSREAAEAIALEDPSWLEDLDGDTEAYANEVKHLDKLSVSEEVFTSGDVITVADWLKLQASEPLEGSELYRQKLEAEGQQRLPLEPPPPDLSAKPL